MNDPILHVIIVNFQTCTNCLHCADFILLSNQQKIYNTNFIEKRSCSFLIRRTVKLILTLDAWETSLSTRVEDTALNAILGIVFGFAVDSNNRKLIYPSVGPGHQKKLMPDQCVIAGEFCEFQYSSVASVHNNDKRFLSMSNPSCPSEHVDDSLEIVSLDLFYAGY